jgi:diguanylate cyclase (GGDEF)-like protein
VSPWVYRVYLAAGLGLAALYAFGGEAAESVAYGLLGNAALIAVLVGCLRHRPQLARFWWLIFTSLAINLIGDAVMGLHVWFYPGSWVLDTLQRVLYLVSYPVLAVALAVLVRRHTVARDLGTLIDAAIVSCSLALPAWILLVAPALAAHQQQRSTLLLSVLSPLGDVALLALLARVLVGAGARTASLAMLCGAMAGWLAGDLVNAVLASDNNQNGYWGGAIYCVSYVLFGAAALHPSMPRLTAAGHGAVTRLSGRRLALLAGMSLLPPSVLLIQANTGQDRVDSTAVGIACVVLFLLVVARMAGLIRRVEEQSRALAHLAAKDGLTGVGNRRSWDAALTAATAIGRPLTVVLLDLDHFKLFNDTYGHQAGDQLLKGAAAAWLDVLRRDDVLYRYGGEEFGLVLTGATEAEAAEIVDRLRPVMPGGQTFSAGLSRWDGVETAGDLVARADAALYRAKENGRDRTESAAAPLSV